MKLIDQGRAKDWGVTALMAVLVFGGTAAAVDTLRTASDTQPAGDVYVPPTDVPEPTTIAVPPPVEPAPGPAPLVEPAPVPQQQAPVTQAPNVQPVTEPAPQAPAADPTQQPTPAEPEIIGSFDANGNFKPAPEPNMVPLATPPVVPKIAGEPGYIAPTPPS